MNKRTHLYKVLFAIIGLSLLGCNAGNPKIEFMSDHQIFNIFKGEKQSFSYLFKNTGKDSLIIKNVSVSCGCTTVGYPKHKVAPNSIDSIVIVYDSKGDSIGPIIKSVLVECNTKPLLHSLTFKGVVKDANLIY